MNVDRDDVTAIMNGVEMSSSNKTFTPMASGKGGHNFNLSKRDVTKSGAEGLKKRDIEFMHHDVTVVKKMGEFGTSYFYSAKDDAQANVLKKSWRGSVKIERHLLIKATTASTKEETRRAETEVRLLRKLRHHPSILKLIDCGFSLLDDTSESGDAPTKSTSRLYCMLFEPCPDFSLSEFLAKQRRKQRQAKPRILLGKFGLKSDWQESGYLDISTVLDIFTQMCEAIKIIHTYRKNDPRNAPRSTGESRQYGVLHLHITPDRFLMRSLSSPAAGNKSGSTYEVKLCSFGCAISGTLSLRNDAERLVASRLLKTVTEDIYKAPEMINFQLSEELTDR